jgi:lipopolysaccharide/colanic/teichoic acid biosynthesis glycosyltransferase
MHAANRTVPHPSRTIAVPMLCIADPAPLAADAAVRVGTEGRVREYIERALRQHSGPQPPAVSWVSSTDPQDLSASAAVARTALVNLAQANSVRRINTLLRVANACLPIGGLYVCRMETLAQRWSRVFRKYPALFAYLFYILTFVLHRALPKLPVTKQLYFRITGGRNRVLSEPEALGRLICCGFEIVESQEIGAQLYIVARKVGVTAPAVNPSYGPLFRAPRIGYRGKKIRVFKLRTMYPYAEYLQEYVYKRNRLAEGGKFKDDFRVTGWGRICRKYWIDELPMIINWLKGDLKLVGVRPLSQQYASLYPEGLLRRRQQTKPGLLPPFYADLPRTFEEILASEEAYLASYERRPFRTDITYLVRALYNILVRRARSA